MSLHPKFTDAVRRLNPDANFGDRPGTPDVIVQDDCDGKGPYLKVWNLPGNPPTDAEIAAAIAQPEKPKDVAKILARLGLTVADLKAEIAKP